MKKLQIILIKKRKIQVGDCMFVWNFAVLSQVGQSLQWPAGGKATLFPPLPQISYHLKYFFTYVVMALIYSFFHCYTGTRDVYQDECVGCVLLLVWWISQGTR